MLCYKLDSPLVWCALTEFHNCQSVKAIMMEAKQSIWKITLLAIFIASLGAAGTSLGLIQANTQNGAHCKLFVSETQARNFNLHNYNIPTCKLSLAGATIATASIALLTVIEIVKVVSQTTTKL